MAQINFRLYKIIYFSLIFDNILVDKEMPKLNTAALKNVIIHVILYIMENAMSSVPCCSVLRCLGSPLCHIPHFEVLSPSLLH